MIKDFIEIVRKLSKLDIKYFRMLSSVRGKLRTYAIYRALDICDAKYGAIPSNPTAEGRAEADAESVEAKDSKHWFPMCQAVAMLVALDNEFGVWDKDEGIEGSFDYQIEANTPKLSREKYAKLVKNAKGSLKGYDDMVAQKEQLERFQGDVLSMLADVYQHQMNEGEIENAPTDADWAGKFLAEAGQKQKEDMDVALLRGWITEAQYDEGTDELDGFIFLSSHA